MDELDRLAELAEVQALLGKYRATKSFRELAREHPEIPGLRALALMEAEAMAAQQRHRST